jgi:peroxiredoxin
MKTTIPAPTALGFIAAVLLAVIMAPFPPTATAAPADPLLEMIPDDVVFCIRINQFNTALGKMDQYLAGVLPAPVSLTMLANMQLAGIVGDPMLTGIDRNGTFSMVGFVSEQGPEIAVLVPLTSYQEFIKNPACSEADIPEMTILAPPGSPIGALALMPAPGGNYALVGPESDKDMLVKVRQRLLGGTAKLSARLDTEQTTQATAAPVWAYINLATLYDLFGPATIESIQAILTQAPQDQPFSEMFEQALPAVSEAVKLFWGQADALTVTLTPEPTAANLDIVFKAKNGSELAGLLVADPQARPGFMLAGYAHDEAAINLVMKNNRPLIKKLAKKFVDMLMATSKDSTLSQEWEQLADYIEKNINAMGYETFVSFNYTAGPPLFMMRQVQHLADPAFYEEGGHQKGFQLANRLYAAMDIPMTFEFARGVETYKNVRIDTLQMPFVDDPNNVELAMLGQMYDAEGFVYYIALKENLLFTTIGPDALKDIKTMIDTASYSTPRGELEKAFTIVGPAARQADTLASINLLKLLKGLFEMMDQAMSPFTGGGGMFGKMKQALDLQTQSCMAFCARIDNGKISFRAALPKQHLTEVITAAMEIQQQIMQQQMEMMQSQGSLGGGMMGGMAGSPESTESISPSPFAMQTPPADQQPYPLQDWIGRPAPNLKLTDIQGNTVSIAELKGKKIVLDFWATWCPPCKEMIPDLIALRGSYTPQQLVILGLSNEPKDQLVPFVKDYKINYPIISYREPLPDPYGKVVGLPTTFFIDSSGVIRQVLVGYHEKADIKAAIDGMQ